MSFPFSRNRSRCCLGFFLAGVLLLPSQVRADELASAEVRQLKLFYDEDELVEAATRTPKPLSQVAENVTVITADEIKAMNAHTVAEVLNRAPGMFVGFAGQDFGSSASLHIQGAEYESTLVLVDGFRLNNNVNGWAETNTIPVQIIKRIELIKGPASSTWGSAMGGVVNIITKDVGHGSRPSGSLTATYGEHNSREIRADLAGGLGTLGYYVYAGSQDSDGLKLDRYFDSEHYYAKANVDLAKGARFTVTAGYSEPDYSYGDFFVLDRRVNAAERIKFVTASLDLPLGETLSLNLAGHSFGKNLHQPNYSLGDSGWYGPAGTYVWDSIDDMENQGVSGRLTWQQEGHTLVLGAETDRDEWNAATAYGPWAQSNWGVEPFSAEAPHYDENWAVYANDTIRLGRLSLTPGLRFDHHSLSKNMTSPSLGATFRLTDTTLLRAAVNQGFRRPWLYTVVNDNPDLRPEKVTAYQVGLESTAFRLFRARTMLFHQAIEETWINSYTENGGPSQRTGIELEAESIPFYNFSLGANATYVDLSLDQWADDYRYTVNLFLRYDRPELLRAELFGHFIRWDERPVLDDRDNVFVWDLNLRKEVSLGRNLTAELFGTVHNLFNNDQYAIFAYPNPDRWVEAGLRFIF